MTVSEQELARYERHLSLAGFGAKAQKWLKHDSVLAIGAGGSVVPRCAVSLQQASAGS